MNDFENTKAGDTVVIRGQYRSLKPAKVSKVTNKQVVVKFSNPVGHEYERRFWKENGREVGSGDMVWRWCSISLPTPEIMEQIEFEKLREQAHYLRDHLGIPQTKAGLEKFIEALTPLVEK